MKTFSISFLWVLLVVLLSGCLGCSTEPRLTFMVGGAPNEIAFLGSLVGSFTAETGIRVELIRQPTDSNQRKQGILLALRGHKEDPDVMLLDVGWIGQMAASNWLEPLEPHGVNRAAFFPSIVDLADTWQGSLIGVPLYVDGGLLYYRRDLLEQHGFVSPPTTWDELRSMGITVQKAERINNPVFWGFVWQGAQYEGLVCHALEVFTSAGGGLFQGSATPILDRPENVKALAFMTSLIHDNPISPPNTFTDMKEEEVRQVFQAGNALFERNWPYAWGLHQAADSPVRGKVGMAPLPAFAGGKSASTLGGWHIVVSRFSDRKHEAASFLKYLTSAPVQKRLALTLGWNPGRMDIYDDPDLLAANPALRDLKNVFLGAVPRPVVPFYSNVSQVLQKHFNAALSGRVTPEEALKKAQDETREVLGDYGL